MADQPGVAGQAPSSSPRINGPAQVRQRVVTPYFLTGIHALVAVTSARLLGLLTIIGSFGIFGYAVFDPAPHRTWTCIVYAAGVVWPMLILYLKTDKPAFNNPE